MATNSTSCRACHLATDNDTMHRQNQGLSCVDCHGGRADVGVPAGIKASDANFYRLKLAAHVVPSQPAQARFSSPTMVEAIGAESLRVDLDYLRFVNPGDLRAATVACYSCHADQVQKVPRA